MKLSLMALFPILLTSCASHRALSRDEWLQVSQRTYTSISKEDLIRSAEKVLFLADGDDFQFAHSQNGFTATRHWSVYLVLSAAVGDDSWSFEVTEEANGKMLARVNASRSAGNIAAYSTGQSTGTITSPNTGAPMQGSAGYDLFWTRLDYLLGKQSQWTDCQLERDKIARNELWGDTDFLCGSVNLKDDYPDNLSDPEIERIFKNRYFDRVNYLKKYRPKK